MPLIAKVSQEEEEQQEEMLHLCLTGFYLRKPVKIIAEETTVDLIL